jgi:hypothetical protein
VLYSRFFLGDFLELNIEQGVQECDATMKNSSNAAGLKKKAARRFPRPAM